MWLFQKSLFRVYMLFFTVGAASTFLIKKTIVTFVCTWLLIYLVHCFTSKTDKDRKKKKIFSKRVKLIIRPKIGCNISYVIKFFYNLFCPYICIWRNFQIHSCYKTLQLKNINHITIILVKFLGYYFNLFAKS